MTPLSQATCNRNLRTYIFECIVRVSHTYECLSVSCSTCWPEDFITICWKFRGTVWEPNSTFLVQHHNSCSETNMKLCYSWMCFPLIKVKHGCAHLYCGQTMLEQHMVAEADRCRAGIQNLQPTMNQWTCELGNFRNHVVMMDVH